MTTVMQIGNYALWFSTTLAMLMAAGAVYIWWTPGNEIKMVRDGNAAAATALGGTVLGYAHVVYAATVANGSIPRVLLWSVISLIIQIIAFEIITRFILGSGWQIKLAEGCMSHGIAIGSFSWAAGWVSSGCLAP